MKKNIANKNVECFVAEEIEEGIKNWIRPSICEKYPNKIEYNGKPYCILHLPTQTKGEEFENELRRKLRQEEFDFSGVYFPDEFHHLMDKTLTKSVNFRFATFSKKVSFSRTEFKQTNFEGATFEKLTDFFSSIFEKTVNFRNAKFMSEVSFIHSIFKEQAHFFSTTFTENTDFTFATFGDNVFFTKSKFDADSKLLFRQVKFSNAVCTFQQADIIGHIHFVGGSRAKVKGNRVTLINKNGKLIKESEETGFIGKESHLDLQYAYIEKPERISFKNIRLQPSWFINVDCKKFIFSNCAWAKPNNELVTIEAELKYLEERCVIDRHYLLMRSCLEMADNCEEMKHFNNASLFRFIANESKRLYYYRGFKIWSLHWWYWLSSFYGESPLWAFIILFSLLFIFAMIFTGIDFQVCPIDKPIALSIQQNVCGRRPLEVWEAIRHSLATATFQNVEYRKPITGWGETWIILEKIFAPLQAALLALAIRRKFMR